MKYENSPPGAFFDFLLTAVGHAMADNVSRWALST